MLFYVCLLGPRSEGPKGRVRSIESLWCADIILGLYGLSEFFDDIEAGREYWRDGDSLAHSVLDWLAGRGFDEFFSRYDSPWKSASAFRQRDLIAATKANNPAWLFGKRSLT